MVQGAPLCRRMEARDTGSGPSTSLDGELWVSESSSVLGPDRSHPDP